MIRKAILVMLSVVVIQLGGSGVCTPMPVNEDTQQVEAAIPFKKQNGPNASSSSRVFLLALLAIGVAFGGALLLRHYLRKKGLMPPVQADRIAIHGAKKLSPKLAVYLVAVDEVEYVIVQSGTQSSIVQHHGVIPE